MSGSSPGATWQGQELATAFMDQRDILVPLLDIQEDIIRRLFERRGRAVGRFLDVGSGNGAMSELILSIQSESKAVLLDFSEPMLDRAGERLERFPDRWRVVHGDLSDPGWADGLPAGGYDAVVSALAIHHLPAERKQLLFVELFDLMEPGGMFVNMDFVLVNGPLRGMFDEQMAIGLLEAERERGGERTAEELEHDIPDDGGDDRPDTVEDQLRWLHDAGFEGVEVHFKWADAAVFGAIKPEGGND